MQNIDALPAHGTDLLFVNHASLLIRSAGRFLLTDPWFDQPAFGSWLPTFPPAVHPIYLAALGTRLSVLISHGHDDHCDDLFLSSLDRGVEIITANFTSPSVLNRLKKIGFENIVIADRNGVRTSQGWFVKSYIDTQRSPDDAIFTIDSGDGLVIHCNDNWFELSPETWSGIATDRARYQASQVAFLSQTNSASGYPLNYANFSGEEKRQILQDKVHRMILQGLRNAASLDLPSMVSYAGYASVFVDGKPECNDAALIPTPRAIEASLAAAFSDSELPARLLDFYPGDSLSLVTGQVSKAFVNSSHYTDAAVKESASRYYRRQGLVDRCDTYRPRKDRPFDIDKLHYFLDQLDAFASRKVAADAAAFASVLGKSLEIVVKDIGITERLVFGQGRTAERASLPNKRLIVDAATLLQVLEAEILFENLYTGYEGEWERFPKHTYNRDIVMFIVMYSYVYKNRPASQYLPPEAV